MSTTAANLNSDAANAVLRLQNVESAYGPIRAIRGVSLQVHKGQIATVLGSNGAGKSTITRRSRASSTRARAVSNSRAKTSRHATLR